MEFVTEYAKQLSLVAANVKHSKFLSEVERRIVTFLFDADWDGLVFRQKRTLLAGHLPLDLTTVHAGGQRRLPITRILIGPGPAQKVSKISVANLLKQQKYNGTPVEMSKIPYRIP